MSDKVTPLHPERERRRKLRRRIWSLVGLVIFVLLLLAVILFHQELNLDRLRRFVTYLNVDTDGDYGHYSYESHNSSAYAAFDDGLAVASVAGLKLFGPDGVETASASSTMTTPALDTGDRVALAWDAGGTSIIAASAKEGTVLDLVTEQALLDADISEGDEIAYAVAADGYRTVLTVLDSNQKETFKWYSSSSYLPLCAVSEGGDQLAAVALGQNEGAFESRLLLLDTAVEDQEGVTVSLGNQMIFDLDYLGSRLCAVGENSLCMVDDNGEVLGTYDYDSSYLMDYSLDGDGYAVLSVNEYRAGSRYSIVTVDDNGEEIASTYLGEEVLSVSAAGNYVAVLTAERLLIYTSDLELYHETVEIAGASRAAMRGDGSVLLIGSDSAELYLP